MLRLKIQFKCWLLKKVLFEYANFHLSPSLNSKSTFKVHAK